VDMFRYWDGRSKVNGRMMADVVGDVEV
jgi:hypothetical protein